ncbi:MAG: ComF family protein [Dehalococcoidales bacterium]|nr:ComF family protein [Dehalococcoidales bacterium]
MLPQADRLKGMALDFLFPKWCVGCGRGGDFICRSCRQKLSPILPPVCPKCGRSQINGVVCPDCVRWQAHVDGIRSPFKFDGVMRKAIHELKYRNLRALAGPLAGMLFDYLRANPIPADVLVPVPLHRKRLRERGYNQSSLLASELGRLTGLALAEDCLARLHYALPQARTPGVIGRRANVAGAFSCRHDGLSGKKVILIDDVSTTGATFDACAAALKEAGAISVWGLALAREV